MSTNKRPAASANTRARRQAQIRRRRQILLSVIILIVVLLIVLFVAFSGIMESHVEESTLTLHEDGSVIYEEIETLDDPAYNSNEIKGFAKEQINAYNADAEGTVKLERFAMDDDTTAYMRVAYDSFPTYLDFTGYEGFNGTIDEAKAAGYELNATFVAPVEVEGEDGTGYAMSEVSPEEVVADGSKKILILRENTAVTVDGTILYVSTDGTTVLSPNTVRIEPIDGNTDIAVLTYIIYE